MSATNGASSIPLRSVVRAKMMAERDLSKARARLSPSDRGQVIPDLAIWGQAARIGGGLTPQRISSIIRMADNGDTRQLMDLANECRQRDPHLQAVLSTSEESIAGLQWQILPPDQARAKDRRAAEFVEETLAAIPNFQRALAVHAGAVYYGFAVSEILWTKDAGKLVPEDFLPIAPRRFRFRIEDARFVWWDEGMMAPLDFREAYPNKFIVSQPRVTGDIPNREGLCRALVWMSVFRNWVIADWLKSAELSWKPWRIGTYKKSGTNVEDRADLEDVLRRLTTDGVGVVADTSTIQVQWPSGAATSKSTHGEFANVLAQEMSKAVLGQTETVQSSSSSGYAQAKVHDAVRKDLREARARVVANDITRDLIAPIIRLNYGDSVAVPRFDFITQDPVDLKAFTEAVNNLKIAGARIPEVWVLEQAGIPQPEDGDVLLGGKVAGAPEAPVAPAPAPTPDPNAPNPDPNAPPAQGAPPQGGQPPAA